MNVRARMDLNCDSMWFEMSGIELRVLRTLWHRLKVVLREKKKLDRNNASLVCL
jgi:hypothetical protein